MPALKKRITKLEDVAESVRSLYKQSGDHFELDLEGDSQAPAQGLSLEDVRTVVEQVLKASGGAAPSAQTQEDRVRERSVKDRLQNLETELANSRQKLASEKVDNVARDILVKHNVNPKAMAQAVAGVRGLFKYDDATGEVLAVQDGKTIFSKKDPSKVLTMEEYVRDQFSVEHDYLFARATGSGATNANAPAFTKVDKNPWVRGTDYSMARQVEITKANPTLAAQLKEQAKTVI